MTADRIALLEFEADYREELCSQADDRGYCKDFSDYRCFHCNLAAAVREAIIELQYKGRK